MATGVVVGSAVILAPASSPPFPPRTPLIRSRAICLNRRSGTSTENREELRTVLDFLRKGDVLMVTRIDRLARSIGGLQDDELLPWNWNPQPDRLAA
jgi:hypothetical protein